MRLRMSFPLPEGHTITPHACHGLVGQRVTLCASGAYLEATVLQANQGAAPGTVSMVVEASDDLLP